MFVQSSAYFISFEFSVYLVVPTVITAFKTIVVSDDLRLTVLLTFLCSQPAESAKSGAFLGSSWPASRPLRWRLSSPNSSRRADVPPGVTAARFPSGGFSSRLVSICPCRDDGPQSLFIGERKPDFYPQYFCPRSAYFIRVNFLHELRPISWAKFLLDFIISQILA